MPWYVVVPIMLPFAALVGAALWIVIRGGDGY
jgi:hypothetical protein